VVSVLTSLKLFLHLMEALSVPIEASILLYDYCLSLIKTFTVSFLWKCLLEGDSLHRTEILELSQAAFNQIYLLGNDRWPILKLVQQKLTAWKLCHFLSFRNEVISQMNGLMLHVLLENFKTS
jgi:hypothetical protein